MGLYLRLHDLTAETHAETELVTNWLFSSWYMLCIMTIDNPDEDSLLPSQQVHHARKEASSSSKHDSTVFQRRSASNSGSEGEMQLLRQLYMNFLRALRHQYLEDLLEMQALCSLLCGIHSPAQTQVWPMAG